MSNFSDATEPGSFYSHKHVFTVLVLSFTTLVGVPGNALVLWVTGVKMERTVTTILFGNLALADIICCLCLPFSVVQFFYPEWLYGPALCKILHFTVILNMFASVFTLVAISVDRWILVVQPVWARNHRRVRTAWMICLAIWVFSSAMSLPVAIYHKTDTFYNKTICFSEYPNKFAVTFTHLTFGFLIPLITISTCYISLAIKAYNITFLDVGRKTIKVALGIVVAFFITWAPYHIMGVVYLFINNDVVDILDLLSQSLAFFNSCINPILYVFIGKDMKKRVRQSVRGLMENVFHEDLSTLSILTCGRRQIEDGRPLEEL
ncbi:C3a anaphylatoxin chemotactic receptor-like [Aquarana catesbeiana]|uniref:C3a anaphylatoxin chemotactic receptor-like n=1 Tax=Aquarana catesbeiana TaxID=8400 RepID=UPI003CC99EDD